MADVSNRILEFREKARPRLTQQALADRSGLTRYTIYRLENDPNAKPALDTMRKVAAVFGLKVSTVFPEVDRKIERVSANV